jgi:DNA-binding transcriptional MocR family regulator
MRGMLALSTTEAGLQVPARLLVPLDSHTVATAAAANHVAVSPLSWYARRALPYDGLVLGFAPVDEREIRSGVIRLSQTLERLCLS